MILILRIESGKQTPKLKTLAKLAAAAGYEVEVNFVPVAGEHEGDVESVAIDSK